MIVGKVQDSYLLSMNEKYFETKTAVQAIQQLGGLTQDGVCGRNTWEKIIRFLPERSRISHELQILQKSIMNPPVIPGSGNVDDNDTTESIEQILKAMEEEFALMLPFIPDEVNVASVEEFKAKYGYYFIGPFSESARINMENGNYLVDRIWKWVNGIDDETYAQYGVELFGGIRSALKDSGLETLKDEIRDIDSVYKNLPTILDTMAFWQGRVIGEAMVSGEMSLKGTADTIMIAFGVVAGAKGIVSVAKSSGAIITKIKPILSNMPKKSANLKQSLLKLRSKMQGFRSVAKVVTEIDIRKFSEYIFKEGATHGKDVVFRNLGYTKEHSELLVDIYKKQAKIKYANGNYGLGKLDEYGQRIDIGIELRGIGEFSGKTSFLKTGWMVKPNGSISLNTPFSGFVN